MRFLGALVTEWWTFAMFMPAPTVVSGARYVFRLYVRPSVRSSVNTYSA